MNCAAANGNTPLHVAASFGDEDLVKLLLRARGINVNVLNTNADGATPLHCAVMHGKLSLLYFFIFYHFSKILILLRLPRDIVIMQVCLFIFIIIIIIIK